MSGKIILNLAISIDGYIADKDGGFDWISGHNDHSTDTGESFDFDGFLGEIDVVLMGSACYNQEMHKPYLKNKKVYVATSKEGMSEEGVSFIGGDIIAPIMKEVADGKNVYLFGGGVVIDVFIKADLIDEYIIGIIPVILGSGRRLFLDDNPKIELKFETQSSDDGVVMLKYLRRK